MEELLDRCGHSTRLSSWLVSVIYFLIPQVLVAFLSSLLCLSLPVSPTPGHNQYRRHLNVYSN